MTTMTPTAPGFAPGAQSTTTDSAAQRATKQVGAVSCAEYARPGQARTNTVLPRPDAVTEQACETVADSSGLCTAPGSAPFLRWLYDNQAGYIEIVAGAPFPDKPSKIDLVMSTRRWCYYDPERPDLIEAAARYAELLSQEPRQCVRRRAALQQEGARDE
jgi:hypothetical protein